MKASPRARRDSDRGVDVMAAAGHVLDALALVGVQVFLDLAAVVGGFVDRDADLAVRAGQGAGEQAGVFALDVEVADFRKLKIRS